MWLIVIAWPFSFLIRFSTLGFVVAIFALCQLKVNRKHPTDSTIVATPGRPRFSIVVAAHSGTNKSRRPILHTVTEL